MNDYICTHCSGIGFIPRYHMSCDGDPKHHVNDTGEVTYVQHYPCNNCDTTGYEMGLEIGKRMKALPNTLKNTLKMWYIK